ncbi:MAG: hypothetical protein KC493_08190 [Bacteriovoracaceae bacterium]|nr:hypothetical protein [Bacteriovoracaceae bacterium]
METSSNQRLVKQPHVGINNEEARKDRVEFLKSLGHEFESYNETQLTAHQVKSNVESFIGTMSIPVGLVGPLLYKNAEGKQEQVFTAAATTEGALIASMNRGVSVMNQAGGFSAHVNQQRMLRAPMFCFDSMADAAEFSEWLLNQIETIKSYIKQYSKRAELVEVKTELMGRNLMCQFYYETGDASGQNMTTICTWQTCLLIEREYNKLYPGKILDYVLDCNGSSDKKVTHDSMLNGRGVNVVAECVIDEEILKKKLKVSSEHLLDWFNKSTYAAQVGGMIGYNVNIANPIAAIFAATGQDLACIHESSVGHLFFEKHPRGIYACLKLPRLVVATVGGGTSLPSQNENLKLMGCQGSGTVNRFAELIAGYCLGLELSTFSAMANGQFAIAHERLGRNKPVNFITEKDNLSSLIQEQVLLNKKVHVAKIDDLSESNGIITEITSQTTNKMIGLSIWELSSESERNLALLKSKPTDKDLLNCMYILTGLIDPKLARTFDEYKDKSDFLNSHIKEILIYEKLNSIHMPKVYGTMKNPDREAYFIMMDLLLKPDYKVMNSELEPDLWTDDYLKKAIKASVSIQESLSELKENEEFTYSPVEDYLKFAEQSYQVLMDEYGTKFSEFMNLYKNSLEYLKTVNEESLHKTIIHNDYNPRNIALSNDEKVVVYDYELARVDVPQRDVIEFLSFMLGSERLNMSLSEIMEFYRNELADEDENWNESLKFALAKYIATRVNLYMLGNKITRYPFLKYVVSNCITLGREFGLC